MPLPQDFLLQLHDRNEIVDLIGSYAQIRRRGRVYTGLCPFHNEKTPSFTVYPDTQSFYCFGCGAGGDAITFIKLRENLDYMEAVRLLAERAGVAMPEDAGEDQMLLRRRVLEANKAAARFFFESLNDDEGKEARAYLRRRHLSDAVIKKFGLGYAPSSWDALKKRLNGQGFQDEELLAAGLCSANESGKSVYDFFRHRLMFPVIDVRGSVIAFSGRALSTQESRKYINTRDTLVFKKSRTLYALNLAKNTKTRCILIAEGQMDVIAIYQAGMDNAVAALGTALTEEHVYSLARYADEVVLSYDGDEAGQKATKRSIELLKSSRLLVKVVSYGDAKDPDEYIQKYGADRYKEQVAMSGNSTEYALKRAEAHLDLSTDGGRLQYLRECAEILAKAPSPTERDLYAGRVAQTAGVEKQSLMMQIEEIRRKSQTRRRKEEDRRLVQHTAQRYDTKRHEGGTLGAAAAERRLTALLFYNPNLAEDIRRDIGREDFISEETGALYEALIRAIQEERFSGLSSVAQDIDDRQMALLSGLLAEHNGINFAEQDAAYLIQKMKAPQNRPDDGRIKQASAADLMQWIENRNNQ